MVTNWRTPAENLGPEGDVRRRRRYRAIPYVDVREVRESLGLSQKDFAKKYGFSLASVEKWERGETRPYPNASILMAILALHPEVVDEVLQLAEATAEP